MWMWSLIKITLIFYYSFQVCCVGLLPLIPDWKPTSTSRTIHFYTNFPHFEVYFLLWMVGSCRSNRESIWKWWGWLPYLSTCVKTFVGYWQKHFTISGRIVMNNLTLLKILMCRIHGRLVRDASFASTKY